MRFRAAVVSAALLCCASSLGASTARAGDYDVPTLSIALAPGTTLLAGHPVIVHAESHPVLAGTVQLYAGTTLLASAPMASGGVALRSTPMAIGRYSLWLQFAPDGAHAPSESPVLVVDVRSAVVASSPPSAGGEHSSSTSHVGVQVPATEVQGKSFHRKPKGHGGLPFTGFDLALAVLVAAFLVIVGVTIARAASSRQVEAL